jgi:hypothetical protein
MTYLITTQGFTMSGYEQLPTPPQRHPIELHNRVQDGDSKFVITTRGQVASGYEQPPPPLHSRLSELNAFIASGEITFDQAAAQLVAEGHALREIDARIAMNRIALVGTTHVVEADGKFTFDTPSDGYRRQIDRQRALAPNPGMSLITRIHNMHRAVDESLVMRQEAEEHLVETTGQSPVSAQYFMATNPRDLEGHLDFFERLGASPTTQVVNTGRGSVILGDESADLGR